MSLLDKVLRTWRLSSDRNRPSQPKIDVAETHFAVGAISVPWVDVSVVRAYKLDLLTVDEIRVSVGFGNPEKILELSEEQEGFEDFIRTADAEFSFCAGWWERLIKPAFERSEVTLFRRE